MNSEHHKHSSLSPFRLLIALMILLAVSLSLTTEVFADNCDDLCHDESKESSQDCDACLCCLPVIKVFVPAVSKSDAYCSPVSMAVNSDPLNNISSPPVDIDHPPQNLL